MKITHMVEFRADLANLLYPNNDSSIVPIRFGDGTQLSEEFGAIDVDYSLLNGNSLFNPRIESGEWIGNGVLRLYIHLRILLYRKAIDRTSVNEVMTYLDYNIYSNKVVDLKDIPFSNKNDAAANSVLLSNGKTAVSRMYPVDANDSKRPKNQFICRKIDLLSGKENYLLYMKNYILPRKRILLAASFGEELYFSFDSCAMVVDASGNEVIGTKTLEKLGQGNKAYEVQSLMCNNDTLYALICEVVRDRCVAQLIVRKHGNGVVTVARTYIPKDKIIHSFMLGPCGVSIILKGEQYTMRDMTCL